MLRHLISASGKLAAFVFCVSALGGSAEAQLTSGIIDDPFTFYYAIYLPNQQLQSMRPGPLDPVNNAMVGRQYYAQQDRRSLYNPISPYASGYDPLRPYSQQGQERKAGAYRYGHSPSNANGTGPALYYNRASQYFPDLAGKTGRQRNANTAGRRGGGPRSGGGGGMGGMGGGMGGMGGGMGGMGGGMF